MAEEVAMVEVAEAAAPAAPVAAVVEEIDNMERLRRVLAKALVVDGVRRGLHEAVKSLAKATKGPDGAIPAGGARLAILAHDCDEASYAKVVKALAAEKGTPLIEIPLAITLGEWCGLCKIDREGKPRKVVSTSCAVISDFGESSAELETLLAHLAKPE